MAGKPRVHEIAAELGIDSKRTLEKLKEIGEFVKGPSSTVEPVSYTHLTLPTIYSV